MQRKGRGRKLSVIEGVSFWPKREGQTFREYRRGKRLALRVYTLSQMEVKHDARTAS